MVQNGRWSSMSTLKFNKWQSIDGVTRNAVLQVVQGSTSTQVVVSNSTTPTETGLSATITPTSATSKILVMTNQAYYLIASAGGGFGAGIELYRDSTLILPARRNASGLSELSINATGTSLLSWLDRHVITYLDSPATTSAITYSTKGSMNTASTNLTITFQLAPAAGVAAPTSTITLMEIAQ